MWKKLIKGIKYWGQVLLLPIYWFSFITPRSKKIWLFGSSFGKRFADNPKYLYLYLNQYKSTEIRSIWITQDQDIVRLLREYNCEVYPNRSLKGIWYCLRGSVYIFDNYSKDISFWLSGGALKINTWHGTPLKKIQMDNTFDKVRHPENAWIKIRCALRRMSDEKPSHYVLTTSKIFEPIFSSAFATKKVLTSGYPRNDILISSKIKNVLNHKEQLYLNKISRKKNESKMHTIFYMPTFRESENLFFKVMDLYEFKNFLDEYNVLLCVKLHPKSKLDMEFKEIEGNNVIVIDKDTDSYVYLTLADALVTDYSSIYFDYLLINKPIIFFDYDLQEYISNSRELYFDYEKYTPGIKVTTMKELEDAFINLDLLESDELFKDFRKKIRLEVFANEKGLASERLYNDILNIIGNKNKYKT